MRFSFIFTAALVTIVDAELAMLKELKDLGLDGIKDLSCFKQVWNSDQPDKDCPTKEDKAGGNCVWCGGASMGKMFAKTGACVNSEQTSFLEKKGMSCGTEAKLATKDDNDESIMDVLVKFGFDDTPDISCMKQVWKDETANTDCGTKKDASGGACVWCDGSEMMKKMLEKTKMAKLEDNPDVEKMIGRAGVCANEKQTSFLEEKGLACSSKKVAPMIE